MLYLVQLLRKLNSMGKTYRRKDLKVRDYDYFGKRKAPDGVSHKDMVENIFRSDK